MKGGKKASAENPNSIQGSGWQKSHLEDAVPGPQPGLHGGRSSGCQTQGGFGGNRAPASQSGDEDPCYITLPSRPKPPASSPEGEGDSIRGNPLLPLPSSGSSQWLLLQVHLPQILGTAQAGDQRRASASFSVPGWRHGSLALTASRAAELPLVPFAPHGIRLPQAGPLKPGEWLRKHLDPNPWYSITSVLFLWRNLLKTQLPLFSLCHPRQREG